MRILYERCCGLDIHKVSIAVCVVITRGGQTEQEIRRFGTMTADLLALLSAIETRRIGPVIDREFSFNEVSAAFRHFKAGAHFGKVVIRAA